MYALWALFAGGVVLDTVLTAAALGRARTLLAGLAWACTTITTAWLLIAYFNFASVLIALLGFYRIFNNARVFEQRMHERYLRRVVARTNLVLMGLQGLVALGWYLWAIWQPHSHVVWGAIAMVQFASALVLLLTIERRLRRTGWPRASQPFSDSELPTLTVAIPARNETEDLTACLEDIVASTYPKLEVIVLDDCSQEKRTSEIIRAFAQRGVRFIKGEKPRETWLAKNQAYDTLAKAASGSYILFCGVDARFAPDSFKQLVTTAMGRNKQMLCVLPWRPLGAKGFALTQAMRYWWELAPPRRLFRRPPVLSSCWIIQKAALKKAGGFGAVTRTIVPEAFFARTLLDADGYSFLRANAKLGIESDKSTAAQQATAVRTRYPQLHRRPENVFLLSALQLTTLVLPYVMLVAGLWMDIGLVAWLLCCATVLALTVCYLRLTLTTRTGTWWFGLIGLPLGALYDIGLLHYSMWRYEFSTVDWKGRNVCIPAMHVVPRLPKF